MLLITDDSEMMQSIKCVFQVMLQVDAKLIDESESSYKGILMFMANKLRYGSSSYKLILVE